MKTMKKNPFLFLMPYDSPTTSLLPFLPARPFLEDSEDDEGDVGGENPDPGGWI